MIFYLGKSQSQAFYHHDYGKLTPTSDAVGGYSMNSGKALSFDIKVTYETKGVKYGIDLKGVSTSLAFDPIINDSLA